MCVFTVRQSSTHWTSRIRSFLLNNSSTKIKSKIESIIQSIVQSRVQSRVQSPESRVQVLYLLIFGLALSSIVFVNTQMQKYYSLVCWPSPTFLVLALETRTYAGSLPRTMQVASMPLGLVSTQVPLISCSTRSSKLPFI